MQIRMKGVLSVAAVAAGGALLLGASGCQQAPFPMEPVHVESPHRMPTVTQVDERFGFVTNDVQLGLNPVVPVAQDLVGELQTAGTGELLLVDSEAPDYMEAPPRKLGPGEYRYVFTPGPTSYKALEDEANAAVAIAMAQAGSAPAVVINQSYYNITPPIVVGGNVAPYYPSYYSSSYGRFRVTAVRYPWVGWCLEAGTGVITAEGTMAADMRGRLGARRGMVRCCR